MTRTVADIAVQVTADIGPLVRNMAKAEAATGRFSGAMKAAGARISSVGATATALGGRMSIATAAIGAATAAAFAFTKQGADLGDAIGNAARAAGMAPEAFQELRYAITEVADIADEDFNAAMVRLNRVIGEAQTGSKSAAKALEAIGISQADIASGAVTTEQAMEAYITAMDGMTDPAIAAAVSTDLFGKAGARMGGLLAGAGDDVKSLRDRAKELGIVMSDEAVAASEQFGDKMGELARQFDGVKTALATALLPVIVNDLIPAIQEKVIPAIMSAIETFGQWVEWFRTLPGPVQEAAAAITGAFAVGGPVLLAIGAVTTAVGALVAGPAAPFVLLAAAAGAIIVAWQVWGDDFKAIVGGAIDGVQAKLDAFLAAVDRIIAKLKSWKDAAAEALQFQPAGAGGFAPDSNADLPQVRGMGDAILNGGSAGNDRLGVAMADGLVNGYTEQIGARLPEIQAVTESVAQAARDQLGIQSPSTVFAEIGDNIGAGLAQGIARSQAMVAASVETLGNTAVAATDSMAGQVLGILGQMFQGSKQIAAAQALVNAWAGASEALKLPFPANLLAFGKVLATGMAAVKNIQSANPGRTGGGGGGGSRGAGGTVAPSGGGVANITLVGDTFSRDSVEQLFRQINDGLKQGRTINLVRA